MNDIKTQVQSALNAFSKGNFLQNTKSLLNILGYESDRTFQLSPNNYEGFAEQFAVSQNNFNPEKARVSDWQSIDIIFQLTQDDIRKTQSLFQTKQVDNKIIESYLFFALSLKGDTYNRSDLVRITREINKLTPMPSMLLFRYNDYLTISVIDRRLHKREGTKDVLEKVTLIKDINIQKTHRAHIEILYDLSLHNLIEKYSVGNFVELHNSWQKTLDTSELNKKFFRELANWYFWAVPNVEFPKGGGLDEKVRNAEAVIRLLTRLIFIWFIKEKRLVPDDLFTETRISNLLKNLEPDSSTYYKAILQNLFFATLNTDPKETPRRWRGKNKGNGQDSHYLIPNVYRYKEEFHAPDEAFALFKDIPFLNGGLFECLDKEIKDEDLKNRPELANLVVQEGKGHILRIDGFSEREENPLCFPNKLFFSDERTVDLNDIYETKNKIYKVRGLINILERYKFTVDENTPVEEEIALDPELLGKVFESLLACYNPKTGTTARKQTGSFYTPREIVNYMVDESLIAYLANAIERHSREGGNPGNPPSSPFSKGGDQNNPTLAKGGKGGFEESVEFRLRHLFSYTDEPHKFAPAEVDTLINAIDNAKILDPACGSGAFPMGLLHKLVYVLGKLDPDNSKWRELQRQKAIKETEETFNISNKEERIKRLFDIDDAFENNSSDYGRKLYLIENCIFGVDIQSIAMQIAKLRFFISLIVDQKADSAKENMGIRPLPNLETKFVAANSLIGIERPKQMALRNPEIDRIEKELKRVRERHFTARTPQTKEKYRKADERLMAEISELLKNDGFPRETTEKLAKWNPYDQNASADFFDPEWMFGITTNSPLAKGDTGGCGGFDAVIGNPPYGGEIDGVDSLAKNYKHLDRQKKSASFFIEVGNKLTNSKGVIAYIIPKSLSFSEGWKKTRELVTHKNRLLSVIDVCKAFEAVLLEQIIICFSKETAGSAYQFSVGEGWDGEIKVRGKGDNKLIDQLDILPMYIDNKKQGILNKLQQGSILLSEISKTFRGLPFQRKVSKSGQPILRGKNIGKYKIYGDIDNITLPKEILSSAKVKELLKPKILSQNIVAHVMNPYDRIIIMATIDNQGLLSLDTVMNTYLTADKFALQYVLAILNSQLASWFYYWFVYNRAVRTMHFDKYYIDKLHVKDIDLKAQQPFITLVDQILAAKKQPPSSPFNKGELRDADTSALERQIDEMVYKLYGLTPEEIEIVEGKE
ncbi:MAG: N-6 DNA methylase [Candidatus Omnitrophica bacterium]|nr:N-6 DNA methylase [Candidatus Omnitrophota bacterium]